MDILDKIENLRVQPKHVRNWYAFVGAFIVTLCIALVWGFVMLQNVTNSDEEVVVQKEVPSSLSRAFADLKQFVGESIASMRTTTEYIKKEEPVVAPQNKLDLDALFASSTKERMQKQLQEGTSTKGAPRATTSPTTNIHEASIHVL